MIYEAFALKYGSTKLSKAAKYYRHDTYGEPDATVGMDFFFWLIRNGERTVLVDCGWETERGAARGYHHEVHPIELLSRMDVTPGEVDHVVLSHMHFDHIGNLDLFPNATFSVARSELDFWAGPYGNRPMLTHSGEPEETAYVVQLQREGRLRLIEEDGEELFAGIRLIPVRGHTPGQLVTEVTTAGGDVVIASDAIHWYEEMDLDRPYWVFHDLEGMFRGFEWLRTRAADPRTSVVAGHDPQVMKRFKKVNDRVVDLAVRQS